MARTVLKDMLVEGLPNLFEHFAVSIILAVIFAFLCSLPFFSSKVLAMLAVLFLFDLVFYIGVLKGRLIELQL